jgi:hypothetical protein
VTFAQPWMLLGALAALIPLLVHLFDRRRPRPHPFAAISFVLRSQKRTASRLKLKRLILYILRTLILLAIPIALARPEWKRSTTAISARGPAATAVVLDTSLSMRFSDGKSLFERGRDEARDALKDLLAEEPATVLLCGPDSTLPGAPGFDRERMRTMIDDAQPTFAAADMTRCLDQAARALEESPLSGKRLVVVSDLTANAFRLEAPAPTLKGPNGEPLQPEIVLRDVASGKVLPNRAIVDLRVEPALQAGPRSFQFTFTVKNFSPEAVSDLETSLKVGDRVVAKGFLDIPAQGTAQKVLTHKFEQGGVFAGDVQLASDALVDDDRRGFVLTVPRELKALVVNGEPHSVRYRDEAFFVDAALDAPGSPVRQEIRDVAAGMRETFADYDVVLLLNVPAPSAEEAAKLQEFVQAGGGLFLSMGPHVEPEAYNQALGALLPRPLRLVKTAAERSEESAETHAARLGTVTFDHPLFGLFTGEAREGLMSSRFYKYMLLEASQAKSSSSEVLATYEDGAPAIAVARKGKGRVLLFTSTVDRDWSDFAIRTSFLPLMQRFAAYLTGSLEEREELRARVGETLTLRPGNDVQPAQAQAPSGAVLDIRLQEDGSVAAGPITEPGVHQVLDSAGKAVPSLAFAATLDPSESDLTRLDAERLAQHFGDAAVKSSAEGGDRPTVPFWTWLLVAAVGAFFLEGVLLRK